MLKTILVAFDGSDQSRKAFAFALELAAKFGAKMVVVGVIRLPEPAVSVEIDAMLDRGKTPRSFRLSRRNLNARASRSIGG